MNIKKVKDAISLCGSLASPNPDGTIMIMPPNLNYSDGISLNEEEYRAYCKATTLTLEEKLYRLKINDKISRLEKGIMH